MPTIKLTGDPDQFAQIKLRIQGWIPFAPLSDKENAATTSAALSETESKLKYAREMLKIEQSQLKRLEKDAPGSIKIKGMKDRIARKQSKVDQLEERVKQEASEAAAPSSNTNDVPASRVLEQTINEDFTLCLPANQNYTRAELQAFTHKIESFIDRWATIQRQVLEQAYDTYKHAYEEELFLEGDAEAVDPDAFPKPTSVAVVASLISFHAFHFYDDDQAIGLSGSCSWDQEHGIGIRVHGDKVIGFGNADVAV